jgi:hypothetical protein
VGWTVGEACSGDQWHGTVCTSVVLAAGGVPQTPCCMRLGQVSAKQDTRTGGLVRLGANTRPQLLACCCRWPALPAGLQAYRLCGRRAAVSRVLWRWAAMQHPQHSMARRSMHSSVRCSGCEAVTGPRGGFACTLLCWQSGPKLMQHQHRISGSRCYTQQAAMAAAHSAWRRALVE